MIFTLNLPKEQIVALKEYAQARGLTVEQWLAQIVDLKGTPLIEQDNADNRPIWEVIKDDMKDVSPEDLASLPKDGASQIDHYLYGHAKRDL